MENPNQQPNNDIELLHTTVLDGLRSFTESSEAIEQQLANEAPGYTVVEKEQSGDCYAVSCANDDPNSGRFTIKEFARRLRDGKRNENVQTITADLSGEGPMVGVTTHNALNRQQIEDAAAFTGSDALKGLRNLIGDFRVVSSKESKRLHNREAKHGGWTLRAAGVERSESAREYRR